jgi:hypothetical protein
VGGATCERTRWAGGCGALRRAGEEEVGQEVDGLTSERGAGR